MLPALTFTPDALVQSHTEHQARSAKDCSWCSGSMAVSDWQIIKDILVVLQQLMQVAIRDLSFEASPVQAMQPTLEMILDQTAAVSGCGKSGS